MIHHYPRPEKYESVEVALTYFTPEFCAALLERNTRNRRQNPRTQRMFGAALREGRAYLSDSAVAVAPDGTLINGQNRLATCVETGIGFWGFLATGVPFESQIIMDTGGKRTFAQHLQIVYGEASANNKAALTMALWKYENGNYGYRGNYFNRPEADVTMLDALWTEVGDEITAAVAFVERTRRKVQYSGTPLALVRLLTARIDEYDSDFFFDRIATGSDLVDGSAILAARNWIATASRTASARPAAEHQVAILIKAWNKYRDGEHVGQLRFRRGGANPEPFPEPK